MSLPETHMPIEELRRTPASDVKKIGWRGVMRDVEQHGAVAVTNHRELQAVIMSRETYDSIQHALHMASRTVESGLESLRRKFDQRLRVLSGPTAGERLRSVMGHAGTQLRGEVKAGESF